MVNNKPHSDETKKKISDKLKGRRPSSETIIKMSISSKGKTHTKETKDKISDKLSGKKFSQEHRAKISESVKNKARNTTTKGRQRDGALRRWNSNNPNSGAQKWKETWNNLSNEEKIKRINKFQSGKKFEDTKPELIFEKILLIKNIEFEKQKRIGIYKVDFYVADTNIIYEIQGCFYHACEQCGHNTYNVEKRKTDLIRKKKLENLGYVVKFIWEHDIIKYKYLLNM